MSDRFMDLLLDRMKKSGASDLHLSVGRPPILRVSGRLEPVRYRVLSDSDYERMLRPMTPRHLWDKFIEVGDTDYAYEIADLARFRVNLFRQQKGRACVIRIIPSKILTLEQLALPSAVRTFTKIDKGLLLVTGPTGSGKSTTLAAIIHEINKLKPMHIITIEDPVEFVHDNIQCLMSQREVGAHSKSFSSALKAALREDPDGILVGEMRDLETIGMALTAAETGLLVFGTLHTNSAPKTIDRLISAFPTERQSEVRGMIATTIQGILAQQLLRRKKGGRVAAVELLLGSPALAAMIRTGKTHQIPAAILAGKARGMVGMDDSLRKLVLDGIIEPHDAVEKALDKDEMRIFISSRTFGSDGPVITFDKPGS